MAGVSSLFDKAKHIKYWQRCHETFLPSAYTSNDSTRLTLACFIISALDILSAPLTARNRQAIRTWVLSLQHPDGGFCGSPSHAPSGEHAHQGTANIAATFFALTLLTLAADSDEEAKVSFEGVNRRKLLQWLKRLQRRDGSFGQNLWEGEPTGGKDMRFIYLASCIRWMMRDNESKTEQKVDDVDVEQIISYIRHGQSYDGGVAEASQHESHAGYTFCAAAALHFLDRPAEAASDPESDGALRQGIPSREKLLAFLAYRPFIYIPREDEEEDSDDETPESEMAWLSLKDDWSHVGHNGRWNKKADTCYCWWVAGTLAILDSSELMNKLPSRRFLLDMTQHRIGGFSKGPGGPPDIYHSYLGLAALATMGEPDLKEFDVGLCCSKATARKIVLARDGLLNADAQSSSAEWEADGFWEASS